VFSRKRNKLTLVRQAEMSECGLACIAMLANFQGIKCNVPLLRRMGQTSSRGASLGDLSRLSDSIGFKLKAYRTEVDALSEQIKAPAILHLVNGHFVVLKSANKKRVKILDPSKGERTFSLAAFAELFSGVVANIEIQNAGLASSISESCESISYKDLLPEGTLLWKSLFGMLVLTLLFQAAVVLTPLFGQYVIDTAIVKNNSEMLFPLALMFTGLTLFHVLARLARELYIFSVYKKLSTLISSVLFEKLTTIEYAFFKKRHTGDVLSRLDSMNQLRDLLARDLVSYIIDGLLVIFTVSIMYVYSALLASIVAIVTVLYVAMRLMCYTPIKSITEEKLVRRANYDNYLIETVKSARSIRIFGDENRRKGSLAKMMDGMVNAEVRLGKWYISFASFHAVIVGLETILVIYFGAKLISVDMLTIGMLFAFIAYKDMFLHSVIQFVDKFIELKLVGVHLERMYDLVYKSGKDEEKNVEEEPELQKGSISLDSVREKSDGKEAIKVDRLAYKFSQQDPYLFENICFSIPKNKISVIIAPSGYGKSTMLDCMTGLIRPSCGLVKYMNKDVYENSSYKEKISAVGQSDILYAGTVAENITMFSESIDKNKLVRAASIACIHEDVMKMKLGYNTFIGDMGASLSGGQMQRALIARAVYRDPHILFLDEATSQIDAETEYKINRNLRDMNITIVMCAHRSETIAIADKVIDLTELNTEVGLRSAQYGA